MRITCTNCNSDFVLPPTQLDPGGMSSSCPFCNTVFKIFPGENEVPKIQFDADVRRKLRVCIECSRDFEAEESEVVPICPECKHKDVSAPPPDKGPWKLSKLGRLIELESDDMVREWIQQGAILPDDEMISPAGGIVFAKQYKQFSEDFREQRRKSRRSTKPGLFPSRNPFATFRRSARWWFLGAVVLFFGWVGYRLITFTPTESAFHPDVQRFLAGIRDSVEPSALPVENLLAQAMIEMAKDRPDAYESAVGLLEQAVLEDGGRSPALLGNLAEAYALASGATDDPKYRVAASGLAGLAVQVAPGRIEGYVARIRTALNAHDIANARLDVQKGLTLDPRSPRLLLARAQTLLATPLNTPTLDEILQSARTAIEIDPTLLEAYDIAGEADALNGDPAGARREFEKRLTTAPDDPKAPYRLGELEEHAGNFTPAREWYRYALRRGPEFVPARLRLALIYDRVDGNPLGAERHLQEILGRFRRFATVQEIFVAQTEMVRILLHTERIPETLDVLQHFPADFARTPPAVFVKADALTAAGRGEEAVSVLKDLVASDPNDERVFLRLGVLLGTRGETDEAIRALRQAVALNPKDLIPYLRAVQFLTNAKRSLEALDFVNAAVFRTQMLDFGDHHQPLEETPDAVPWASLSDVAVRLAKERKEQFAAHAFLGLCRLQEGLDRKDPARIRQGLAALSYAKKLNNNQESIWMYLGRAHLLLGNFKKARSAFEESLRLNALNPAARVGLAESLIAARIYATAQAELDHVLSDSDWGGRALYLSGNVLAAEKRGPEAEDHWKASLKADPSFIPPWRALLATKN